MTKMKMNTQIEEAEFNISPQLTIRYKKGYGFWILKEVRHLWQIYTNTFAMNPHGMGFKEQYGFGFDDMKPFFFKSFEEALDKSEHVNEFEYWEYNKSTHDKLFDTILRKERAKKVLKGMTKELEKIIEKSKLK